MSSLTNAISFLTTGATVEQVHKFVLNTASDLQSKVSSATRSKIEVFKQKFSIGDCQAVCETIEQLTGGLVKFGTAPQKKSFTVRIQKTESRNETIEATSADEAAAIARNRFSGYSVAVV